MGKGLCDLLLAYVPKGVTRGMLENKLMLKHSFQDEDVADSSFVTGLRVPAFRMIESKRPKVWIVEVIAAFAVVSLVMSL
jgi:hypothetical protein